jgi:hypothetical protein
MIMNAGNTVGPEKLGSKVFDVAKNLPHVRQLLL